MQGTVLNGHSIRKAENCWYRISLLPYSFGEGSHKDQGEGLVSTCLLESNPGYAAGMGASPGFTCDLLAVRLSILTESICFSSQLSWVYAQVRAALTLGMSVSLISADHKPRLASTPSTHRLSKYPAGRSRNAFLLTWASSLWPRLG